MKAAAVIPALDEEGAIPAVVRALIEGGAVDQVVVVDNGSTDRTALVAREAGATVVSEPNRGYGNACLRGIAALAQREGGPPEVVVFVDGDGSNDCAEVPLLLREIERGAQLVIGSRVRRSEPGSLTVPQRFGNQLATTLMRVLHGIRYTDLGPFRAITWDGLTRIGMEDQTYGWTVEMQLKAAKFGLQVAEVDVANKPRTAGRSKVAGTVRGVVGAGTKIIGTIVRYR
jgi:glycosyltransferase involved in cell wall biosynthesis